MILFLQYRFTGDSFITIPRYNDVILPVPWYIVISGFHCTNVSGPQKSAAAIFTLKCMHRGVRGFCKYKMENRFQHESLGRISKRKRLSSVIYLAYQSPKEGLLQIGRMWSKRLQEDVQITSLHPQEEMILWETSYLEILKSNLVPYKSLSNRGIRLLNSFLAE